MKAFIYVGGEVNASNLTEHPKSDDLRIAADGGYENAKKLGEKIDVLVGDLDSIQSEMPEGAELIKVPAEKDFTDTQLAVETAIKRGARDIVIIGGGPAGLSAALAARRSGIESILVLERDSLLGGILNQCIHAGFGLHTFKEELTGPEYAAKYIELLRQTCVEVKSDTMVIHLTEDKQVHCVSAEGGYEIFTAKAVILAMGCRERSRGALNICGSRCAGIYSAGTAQKLVLNMLSTGAMIKTGKVVGNLNNDRLKQIRYLLFTRIRHS